MYGGWKGNCRLPRPHDWPLFKEVLRDSIGGEKNQVDHDLPIWLTFFVTATAIRTTISTGLCRAVSIFFTKHQPTSPGNHDKSQISTHSKLFRLLLILSGLSSFLFPLHAQQPQQRSSYEGQRVGLVDLVARPTMDVGSLRPLVMQEAGEPYADDKVQRTVEALRLTKLFSKVAIEVTPRPDGLQVLFVLQPAFYIGAISFPGATRAFTYSRLFDVVNYPAQEAYEESRVKAAEPALQRFFANNGYFTAQVQSETRIDEAHQLANVIFHVTLNKQAKIGRVEVTGPPGPEAARLVSALHSFRAFFKGASLKTGKPYDPTRVRAAVTFLKNTLGDENRLANQVHLEPRNYHPETNRADVIFKVTLGPTVSLKVMDAKISKRNLRKLIPIFEENAVDQDLLEEGKRNLIAFFQGQGYSDVKIQTQKEDQASQISLIYQVDKGERHSIGNVAIAGNRNFNEGDLRGQLKVEKGHLFSRGKFSQDLAKRSVNNLTAYYLNAGFADVQVQPEIESRDHRLNITFKIAEGEQTLVDSFRIEGNKDQTIDALVPDGLNLDAGQPYSKARLDEDRNRIVAGYLNLGYLNVNFKSIVDSLVKNRSPRVAVTYLIDEGQQIQIGHVSYLGAEHMRQSFIQRNTTVKPGDPLSEGKMLESESRLYNLGDFDWADVSPRKPITDQTQEEVLVKVHEASRNSLTFGFGFESTSRSGSLSSGVISLPGLPTVGLPSEFAVIEKSIFSPIGSIEYSRLDMRGLGETGSVSTLLSILDQKAALSYSMPQFQGLNWRALWSLSGERNSMNPLFTAQSGMGSFHVEKVLDSARTERLQFQYTFQRSSISNLLIKNFIPAADQSIRSSFLSASFIRDTRDKPLDAHEGVFQTVDFRINPKIIGSSDNFVRFFGQTSYYWQVAPWMVWANNVRVGLIKAFGGSHVPFSEQFFSGGAVSLRGFPLNGAGPQGTAILCTKANDSSTCTAKITVPTGGNQLFIFNTEGRFPIPPPASFLKGLGGVIFYDGGNVYRRVGFGQFFAGYSNTVGVGLRYQTPLGPLRIDLGRNLNPVAGLKSLQLFVTLGQSF